MWPRHLLWVEVTYGDGTHDTVHPTDGAGLYPVPRSESSKNDWVREFIAYAARGHVVGREALKKPPAR
jgi:hypothetical protein